MIPGLPARPRAGHKGTFGTVLVVGGSRGMAGAAALCGRAVLRGGAGLCRVGCPASIQPQVAQMVPCATTLPLGEGTGRLGPSALEPLVEEARRADCMALGPGLGQGPDQGALVRALIGRVALPLVVDADGLNVLAGAEEGLGAGGAPVLTPHPGEAARLLGTTPAMIQADREGAALRLARWCGGVCLLKGAGTVVTDGASLYVNATGDPGMATGGCGDVLTGLVAALLAQGMAPFEGACLGAWLPGRAGEFSAARLGPWSMTAEDLLEDLPRAFLERAAAEGGAR